MAFMCLAMVAGIELRSLPGLDLVSQSLGRQMAQEQETQAPKPPEASFPYGSVPPAQSINAPTARPPLVTAQGIR